MRCGFRSPRIRRPASALLPVSRGGRSVSRLAREQRFEVGPELGGECRVFERVVDGRLEVTELLTGVVALPFEDQAIEVAGAEELAQGVGQLDLAAGAA